MRRRAPKTLLGSVPAPPICSMKLTSLARLRFAPPLGFGPTQASPGSASSRGAAYLARVRPSREQTQAVLADNAWLTWHPFSYGDEKDSTRRALLGSRLRRVLEDDSRGRGPQDIRSGGRPSDRLR